MRTTNYQEQTMVLEVIKSLGAASHERIVAETKLIPGEVSWALNQLETHRRISYCEGPGLYVEAE